MFILSNFTDSIIRRDRKRLQSILNVWNMNVSESGYSGSIDIRISHAYVILKAIIFSPVIIDIRNFTSLLETLTTSQSTRTYHVRFKAIVEKIISEPTKLFNNVQFCWTSTHIALLLRPIYATPIFVRQTNKEHSRFLCANHSPSPPPLHC